MKPYYKEAFDFVNKFHPVPDSVFDKLYEMGTYREIKSNKKLLRQGVIPQKLYFLAKGVVRSYIILDSGKELTKTLINEYMFFSSFRALLKQRPTNTIFETLTDCHIFEIDFKDFYLLCYQDMNVMTVYNRYLEYLILLNESRFIELSTKDATKRYLALRERIHNLDNIIPQYQIAASLGITPVQLSRIRAKL
ncbi:Crp/Fnr family transcriptional regulator [uncultured Lacinutrix sp.]|uniref:Crp/Fnr family transcriptional regulator n=1 Tax=uncultured Lacinutrix sp. TaxID=574032 RepID=UPI002618CF92|nr:Crp/Fnr family transcriptional regulator [uncultured Lacinutrix sp.]